MPLTLLTTRLTKVCGEILVSALLVQRFPRFQGSLILQNCCIKKSDFKYQNGLSSIYSSTTTKHKRFDAGRAIAKDSSSLPR